MQAAEGNYWKYLTRSNRPDFHDKIDSQIFSSTFKGQHSQSEQLNFYLEIQMTPQRDQRDC